jgi:hypothetical protein
LPDATVWLRARLFAFAERNGNDGRLVNEVKSGKNFFNSPDQARGRRGSEVFSSDRVKLERDPDALESFESRTAAGNGAE